MVYGGLEKEHWDFDEACGEPKKTRTQPDYAVYPEISPGEPKPRLPDSYKAPGILAVLTRAFEENPRVKHPDVMAGLAIKTCRGYAHDDDGKFQPLVFEEYTSVAAMAAVDGKGAATSGAILDYLAGKYPGPNGERVYGCGPEPKATVMSPQSQDGNLASPLEFLAATERENNGRHTGSSGKGASAYVPPTTRDDDNQEQRENLAEVIIRVHLGVMLRKYAADDPDGVEAFDRLYLGPNFPGATLGRFSQRDEAESMGVGKDTLKTRADRIKRRLMEDTPFAEGTRKAYRLRHDTSFHGEIEFEPISLAGVLVTADRPGGIRHVCDRGFRCREQHPTVTITTR